jgi:hypothetical protein
VNACLPKDGEGNFIAERKQSDVVHDLLGWLEGYLGAKMADLTPKAIAHIATTITIIRLFGHEKR